MLLYRVRPDGRFVAVDDAGVARPLAGDPFATPARGWSLGEPLELSSDRLMAPLAPGKVVAIGRSYRDHALELDNPVPDEPILFLKSPGSVIGPGESIELPPESSRVEFEGEIALVVGRRLCRASPAEAAAAIFGVTCACDVTARDLQRRDPCFSRAKSFDTFCPLGPAIRLGASCESLELVTRVDGAERQRAAVTEMIWRPEELLAYASRMMTLEAGDLLLTGTPAGVGPLADGQLVEVEVAGVGVLSSPVRRRR